MEPGTVVVGAGLSGLAYASWAQRRGERVVVHEASDRVGGVVRTDLVRGYRLERAATTIPSSARHALLLAAGLPTPFPLRPAALAASRQLLWRRSGLVPVPRSPRDLLASPLVGPSAALRLLAETLRGPRRVRRAETLHAFVRRRFGIVPAERLLRPFTSGVYASPPEALGAADAFPRLAAMEGRRGSVLLAMLGAGGAKRELLVPQGGMEAFARALAAPLQVRTVPGTIPTYSPRDGGETVLAVPADVQAELVRPFAPVAADLLDAVRYVPVAVVALGFRREGGPHVPDAFGFLRAAGHRVRILGATFLSRIDPTAAPEGCELLNVYLGGAADPDALDLSDGELRDVVLDEVGRALGGRIEPDLLEVWRWRRAIPLFSPGHRGRMARAQAEVGRFGVRLLGSHVTGVGVAACCAAGAPVDALPAGVRRA